MIAWPELTACARMTAVSLLKFLGSTLGVKVIFNDINRESFLTVLHEGQLECERGQGSS